jgi:hypothetical protein
MSVVQIVGFGAGYLLFLAFLLFVVRPKTQRQRIQVLVNSVGLPLSSEMEPIVIANQKREVRAGFVGIVIGVVAASVGMILAGVTIPGEMFLVDFTSIIVFTGITIAISTLIREHRRQDSGIRFARVRAVGIADYRDAFERWMPRIIVVLALAAFALRAALSPSAFGLTAAFLYLYAVLTVVSLAISEVASRVLVTRGQPAGSALELAWDDALRSRALTAISVAPFVLGSYFGIAAVALYPSSGSAGDALGVRAEVLVVFAACALLLVSAIRSGLTKTGQRYLRRLWPELLAPVAAVPSSRAH